MTGVQTCALPICFPVTIWSNTEDAATCYGEYAKDDDEEGGDEDGETMGFDTSQLQQMQQEMMQQAMQNIDMEQIQKMQQLAMENMQKMMAGMYGNNNNTEEDTNK